MNHQSKDSPWKDSSFHKSSPNGRNQLQSDDEDDVTNQDLFFGMFADPEPYETYQYDFSPSIRISLRGQKQENGQLISSTGLTLWKASDLLSRYLMDHHVDIVKNNTVLEVG